MQFELWIKIILKMVAITVDFRICLQLILFIDEQYIYIKVHFFAKQIAGTCIE